MNINFKSVKVIDLDGNTVEYDISKDLGNIIYKLTNDLGALELARSIYNNGEVDITADLAVIIKSFIDLLFKAYIKEVMDAELDKIINNKDENTDKQ